LPPTNLAIAVQAVVRTPCIATGNGFPPRHTGSVQCTYRACPMKDRCKNHDQHECHNGGAKPGQMSPGSIDASTAHIVLHREAVLTHLARKLSRQAQTKCITPRHLPFQRQPWLQVVGTHGCLGCSARTSQRGPVWCSRQYFAGRALALPDVRFTFPSPPTQTPSRRQW
jgi:hypothetical protein